MTGEGGSGGGGFRLDDYMENGVSQSNAQMITYLQSLNVELGYEAGAAALHLAHGDPHLAQHM